MSGTCNSLFKMSFMVKFTGYGVFCSYSKCNFSRLYINVTFRVSLSPKNISYSYRPTKIIFRILVPPLCNTILSPKYLKVLSQAFEL